MPIATLVEMIATRLRIKAPARPAAASASLASASAGEERDPQRGARGDASTPRDGRPAITDAVCFGCDKKGHVHVSTKQCPTSCKKCGLPYCTGN